MRATSTRDGALSSWLMVGCEHRLRPLSGARPMASLKSGSPRGVPQSSACSYPHAIANMRKRSIADSVWTTRSGWRRSRMRRAGVSAIPEPVFRRAQQDQITTLREQRPAKPAVIFLQLTAG